MTEDFGAWLGTYVKGPMTATRVGRKVTTKSFKKRQLTKWPAVSRLDEFKMLIFDENPIGTFEGLPSLRNLETLYLNNTQIESFQGIPELPRLKTLALRDTPISKYKSLTLMCVILFGDSLKVVNGDRIPMSVTQMATAIRELAAPHLLNGWMIGGTNPLRLFHPKTRARITLHRTTPTDLPPPAMSSHSPGTPVKSAKEDAWRVETHTQTPRSRCRTSELPDDDAITARMEALKDELVHDSTMRAMKSTDQSFDESRRFSPKRQGASSRASTVAEEEEEEEEEDVDAAEAPE